MTQELDHVPAQQDSCAKRHHNGQVSKGAVPFVRIPAGKALVQAISERPKISGDEHPRIRRLGSKLPERLKRHRRKEGDDAVCKQVSQAAGEERQQGKSQCLKIRNLVLRTKTISSAQRIRHVSCHDNARKEGAYGNEVANDTADISSRKREHQENVVSRLSVCKHAAMQQIGKRIHMPASKGDDQPKGDPLRDGLGWCLPTDRPTRRLPQPRPHRCSREPWRLAPAQALR